MVVRALVGAMALCVVACSPFGGGAFTCDRDEQCTGGRCAAGYCGFADPSCESGYRYGDSSGTMSNACVGATSAGSDASVIDIDAKVFLDAPPPGVTCFGTGFGKTCFKTENIPAAPATLTAQTIDTDTSPLCSIVVENNPGWCVIAATELSITGTVSAHGAKPLVLVATGTLQVDGTLDVASHRGGQIGAGAVTAATTACDAGTPPANGGGGGAGGSFGAVGGNGGNNGGTAGAVKPTTTMRGGCTGQDGKGGTSGTKGAGGGVAYLIGGTKIAVTGAVNASGAAATGGVTGNAGAGGGGSGGLIGLDSPIVMNTGAIFANGGGGAEGSGNTTKGNDGNESTTGAAAAQTASASNGGDGGAGGAGTAAGNGGNAPTFGGGGGGGGAGAVKLFQATTVAGGLVSPPAT